MHLDLEAVLVSPLDHGSGVLGVLHAAQADLAHDPQALSLHLLEVLLGQALLQDHGAAVDLHAGGTGVLEGLVGEDSHALGADGILGTAGHMALTGGDDGGDAAVQLSLNEADGLLTMTVVAHGDMDMGIEQAGSHGGTGSVDDLVGLHAAGDSLAADSRDLAVDNNDGVALSDRLCDVTGQDLANVLNHNSSHGKKLLSKLGTVLLGMRNYQHTDKDE